MSTAISIFSLSTFYMSVGTFDVMGLQDLCHRIITSVGIHFLEAAANYSRQRPVAGESVSAKKLLRIQCWRLLGDQSWRSDIYASYKRSGVFGFLMMCSILAIIRPDLCISYSYSIQIKGNNRKHWKAKRNWK